MYGRGLPWKLILDNIYRPPRDVNENYKNFIDEFKHVISNLGNNSTDVIITGDTNIDLLKISEREVFCDFFDSVTSHSFYPSITLPTRFSNTRGTLIDNVCCKLSNTTLNAPSGILIRQFSDHKPYFICLVKLNRNNPPPKFIKIRIQNNKNINSPCTELINSNIINKLNTSPNADPNNNYNILRTLIENATNKHIPDKLVKFNKHKHTKFNWITIGIIKSISFRDKLHYEFKQTTPNTVQHTTLKINLSTYNKILKKNIRAAKLAYYEACFEKYKHDICKTWSTINNILNKSRKKKSFPETFKEDGQTISGKIEIANNFNQYFTNIGLNLAQKIKTPTNLQLQRLFEDKISQCFQIWRSHYWWDRKINRQSETQIQLWMGQHVYKTHEVNQSSSS